MRKFTFGLVLAFLLVIAQASAVGLFLNWPDGGTDLREFTQGQDVAFNYDAFDFSANVHTKILLINANNPNNPVSTVVDRTDYKGHYGYVVFDTDNLPAGEYTLHGTATANGVTSVDYLDFDVVSSQSPNTPPYFVNLPTYFEYKLSDKYDVLMNIAKYVRDDEGDSLSYVLDETNTNTDVVDCHLYFESSLRCDFIGQGITTVDVVISDGEFTVRKTVTIKIIDDTVSNTAPYFVNLPSPFTYELDLGQVTVLQLSDYAVDDEGDALTYSVTGGSGVVACSIQQTDQLVCNLLKTGSAQVQVKVSDGELFDTESITINVVDNSQHNTAPYFKNLPTYFEYQVSQGSADLVDLANYAYDDEGDELFFSLTESISGISCSIVQDSVVRCNFNTVKSGTFTVKVSDGELSDVKTLTIKIIEDPKENTAPYWKGLPFSYEYDVSQSSATLATLSNYAFDNDGDVLSYILDESKTNKNIADCYIDASSRLKCAFKGIEGKTTVDVVVSDGELSDRQTLTITIVDQNPNQPPVWNSNLELYYSYDIDESPVIVFDANKFVVDPDGDVIDFSLDESKTNFGIMNCFLSGTRLVCNLNGLGTSTVDIIASDGEYNSKITVTINVYDQVENHAPYWKYNLPDYFEYDLDEGNVNVLNLASYAVDPDGDQLTFTLDQSSTNFQVLDCKINAGSILNCDLNGVGTTTVDVVVSDGEFTARETITIKVYQQNPNQPPKWSNNLDLYYSYHIDASPVSVVYLRSYVSDPDGDSISITLDESQNDFSVMNCFLSTSDLLVCVLNGVGTSQVKAIASDGQLQSEVTITINVYDDPNQKPYFKADMPTYFEYNIDQGNVELFNIAQYVVDPDGDTLSYSLDESNTDKNIVDCYLFGSRIKCDINGVGTTTVDVVVSDGEFTIRKTLTIKVFEIVPPNHAPYWKTMPDYFKYNLEQDEVNVLNLASYAVDPDGDKLTFTLDETNTNPAVVDCSLIGTTLHCSLTGVGKTTLDVIVTDGELSATKTITIEVVKQNYPPKWKTYLPDYFEYDIDEGNVDVLNLADFVSDPDGDELTFSVKQSSTEIVDCDIRGTSILNCDLNSVGYTYVTVTVSDGEYEVNDRIKIKVYQDNEAPYFVNLPTYFEYDIDLENVQVLNLLNYVEDPDDDDLTFSLDTSKTDADVIDCTLQYQGAILNCNLNGVGITTVDVVVSDGEFTISKTITIKVYQDNVKHQWSANLPTEFSYPLSSQVVTVLKVSDYVINPDGNELTYILNEAATDQSIIDCSLNSQTQLICVLNDVGTTTVDIRVSDAQYTIVETLTITVYDDNTPPQFKLNMPTYFEYDIDLENVNVLDIAQYVYDVDGDSLTYSLDESNTNKNIVDCSLLGSTLNCDLNNIGTSTVDVIASDGKASIRKTLTIKVYQDNTPPHFTNFNKYYEYNIDLGQVTVLKLSTVVTDAQNDALTFTLDESNTNKNVVDCSIATNTDLECDLNSVGQTTLDVIVSDGEFTDKATITIEVFEVNQPPQFKVNTPVFFSYPLSMQEATLFKVADYVTDANGDDLSYWLDQSQTNKNIVDCSIDSNSVITCDLNGVGTTTVDVVVSDGEYEVRKTVTVEVYNDNTPPYFGTNMPKYFEYPLSLGQANLFKISNYVFDDQGDQLSISLDTTNTDVNIVSCSVLQDSTLACEFNGVGTTTVDVVVSDGQFTVRETITIKIFDDTPVGPVAIIKADGNRNTVGEAFSFNGYSSYTVPNEYIVSYDWVIRNPDGVAIALFAGPAQTYTFTDQNEYTIELTVTDSQGLTDTDTFIMQSRWGEAPKRDFGLEDGLFINSLEIHGTGFERAEIEGEILIVATVENLADEDIKDLRMVFTIPELGYKVKSNAIDLRDGERETIQIFEYLPDYVTEGVYYPVVSFSDTELRRSKPMYLEVHN